MGETKATEAAKALSALGAKKGGIARAKALTAKQRSEIARAAGTARWGTGRVMKATHGSPERPLRIGDCEVTCYVLEDGRRVVSQRGLQTALGISTSGGSNGAHRTARIIEKIENKLSVINELSVRMKAPILFMPPVGGNRAYGYEATTLIDAGELILKARDANGILLPNQAKYALAADIVIRAFAKVGIIAVIDEVTGYQEIRDREALQEILKRYISEELMAWVRTFPLEFYKQIFRLKRWNWNDGRMSPIMGNIVNDLVYSRLAPGVLEELRKRNPVTEKGYREHKHFQFLTTDFGHPALTRHLHELIGMARPFSAGEWDSYYSLVSREFPKTNTTPFLPFEEGETI